jgi:calcineurin-like phosphoesterase family protein
MDDQLIKNINYWVKADDILYHLGDFAFGTKEKIKSYLSRLECKRNFLILGNHDRYSPVQYMEMGFEWASRFPIIFDNFMILSHEKIFINNNCQPYFLLHGHEHNSTSLYTKDFPSMNISIENTGYLPIKYDRIKSIIKANESVTNIL